ncbi:MAG: hypothetical protein QG646_3351 [Euryarchaeota archaeon]|nr:hypothetical protein [Euryarchaeota archaeon]
MDFRKLCWIACVFLLILFSMGNALATTIHGTVYEWNSFKPLNNTIVEVNSTPTQYLVATDANYSFNLTPGTYLITANYFEGNTLVYAAHENVVISNQGEFVHDLLLFPPYDEELLSRQGSEVPDMNFSTVQSSQPTQPAQPAQPLKNVSNPSSENFYMVSALFAFIIIVLLGIYLLNHFSKNRSKKPPEIITGFSSEDELSGRNRDIKRSETGNPLIQAEYSEENKRGSAETSKKHLEDISEKSLEQSSTDNSEKSLNDNSKKSSKESLEQSSKESLEESTKESLEQSSKESLEQSSKESLEESTEENSEEILDDSLDDGYEIKPKLSTSTDTEAEELGEDRNVNLPEDLKDLLEMIRANGNRITQRELRKKSPYSESKVSLMLSDLEERGLIEKFKRGRGNIIRIPDEHIAKQTEEESKQE